MPEGMGGAKNNTLFSLAIFAAKTGTSPAKALTA
jgi:hypothetical protein